MANKYFNEDFKVCTIEHNPMYIYIDNVEDFLNDCGDDWISDNVDKTGIYQWDNESWTWEIANSTIDDKIRALIEKTNSIRQEKSSQDNNKIVRWNILVTLDTDETIKINSESVSINDIHEAIDILLKPSFFGKRIKKFEIVAE